MQQNFDYLDQPELLNRYVSVENSAATARFFLDGINCSKCVQKIESQSLKFPGLFSVSANLAQKMVTVIYQPDKIRPSQVADIFQSLGYKVTPLKKGKSAQELLQDDRKHQLMRLGVAGFFAGQIMMLSFAIYFGLAGDLKRIFEWAQFVLYLPVVTYVAWPFYLGFWKGLKQKSLSIDGPMAIASFLGFTISTYHLFRGQGSVYFDSTSGFLFLILVTRYFHLVIRSEYLNHLRPTALMEDLKVQRKNKLGHYQWTSGDQLHKGDLIKLNLGDICPADTKLVSNEANFNFSLLNGESQIKRCEKSQLVPAGAKIESETAELEVQSVGLETGLGQILDKLSSVIDRKSSQINLTDKISQKLLAAVLITGGIFMLLSLLMGNSDYYERGFALIILACPCAMAFGAPLAYAMALKKARERGFVFKNDSTFSRLKNVKTLFFDKTGTLTMPHLNIQFISPTLSENETKAIILSLERQSRHPIAEGLRRAWPDIKTTELVVENFREIPHKGVEGKIQGLTYFFGNRQTESRHAFGLWQDLQLLAEIKISFEVVPELKKTFQDLKNHGFIVGLISGDSQEPCEKVSHELGIPLENTFYQTTAFQKAEILKNHPQAMMVGDGLNDSLAMGESHVSLAVQGSVDSALKTSDIFMIHGDLKKLPELFQISSYAQIQVRNNIYAALIYNSLGAVLALGGWASPFVAALLMPVSSLFILFSTLWSEKRWKFS
jgi:Cu+-exporting ATPase